MVSIVVRDFANVSVIYLVFVFNLKTIFLLLNNERKSCFVAANLKKQGKKACHLITIYIKLHSVTLNATMRFTLCGINQMLFFCLSSLANGRVRFMLIALLVTRLGWTCCCLSCCFNSSMAELCYALAITHSLLVIVE